MPYITQEARDRLHATEMAETSGELNYMLTAICLDYLSRKGKSYDTMNAVVGALECAKLEMYRRVIAGYEQEKCAINGDVYHK